MNGVLRNSYNFKINKFKDLKIESKNSNAKSVKFPHPKTRRLQKQIT